MKLPKAGEKIVVTVNNMRGAMRRGPLAHLIPDVIDLVGVMNDGVRLEEDTFSIIVAGSPVPVRVIHYRNVVKVNGVDFHHNATDKQAKIFDVVGSKGSKYTVRFDGQMWKCNCPAGSHGRGCKHIVECQQRK